MAKKVATPVKKSVSKQATVKKKVATIVTKAQAPKIEVVEPLEMPQPSLAATATQEEQLFRNIPEGASEAVQLEVHQHNIQLIHKQMEYLIATVLIDVEDTVVMAAVARITLMEKKILAIGSRINYLASRLN